jgi:hypothetical protein
LGYLSALWDITKDPDDSTAPYTPYSFVPAGHLSPINMSMQRDFGRRESIMSIPEMDGVISGHGRHAGPTDVRYITFGFRVFTNGDNDAAYDLLAAQVAPGFPQRLVYQMDSGTLWFTVGYTPSIKQTVTSADNWGAGGYCDFSVTWRIRPDWWLRYSETVDVWLPNEGTFDVANDETFSNDGMTVITSTSQAFTLDARGIAGTNLPTIPDYGAKFYIVGPAGGSAGIGVANNNATVLDGNGASQPVFFTLPFNLPTANDSAFLDFGSQTFYHTTGGTYATFRPFKPDYQAHYFRVQPGVLNNCVVTAFGSSPLTGGSVTADWRRKRA